MSSGFVSEAEIAEARKLRQEEWDKVRSADQPTERPEEPYDGRSLFDRLKEQKVKKDMEYEEAHKLKNLIRGLDDDEVQFLEQVDAGRMAAEKRQMKEDEQELQEYRKRVATLQEECVDKYIKTEVQQTNKPKSTGNSTTRPSQKELLGVGIKRKSSESTNEQTDNKTTKICVPAKSLDRGQLKCVAILPGIGPYTESSDSELSTGSEEDVLEQGFCKYDLVGRAQKQAYKSQQQHG